MIQCNMTWVGKYRLQKRGDAMQFSLTEVVMLGMFMLAFLTYLNKRK